MEIIVYDPNEILKRPKDIHHHQCLYCYTIWRHDTYSKATLKKGSKLAHTCPNCGKERYERAPKYERSRY